MKIDITSTLLQAAERCAADYQGAVARGDLEHALTDAEKCIFIYLKLAESKPYHPQEFHRKVKEWKTVAASLSKQVREKARHQHQNSPASIGPEKAGEEKKSGEQVQEKTSAPKPLNVEDERGAGPQVDIKPLAPEPEKTGNGTPVIPDLKEITDQFWKDNLPALSDIEVPVIDAVFHIALEIAREGREGRPVGTAFLVGDADAVLKLSRQLILNPFQGHREEDRSITNPEMKECIKELAQLDGAFIVRGNGIVEAAARYITMDTSRVTIPPGHGTRHSSIAAVTQETKSIGIIVSQSGGKISFIREGKIFKTIHP
jgi:DNA integrity scanning protein DisA with diadenylate cyclase activity